MIPAGNIQDIEGKIRVISAGAGSGKTHRIAAEITAALTAPDTRVRPEGVIATTFTNKAARELKSRVRRALYASGNPTVASGIESAYVGTIHSICARLLQRFAFELGISPDISVMDEKEQELIFGESISGALTEEDQQSLTRTGEMFRNAYYEDLPDSRHEIRNLIDVLRANDLSEEDLARSEDTSWSHFADLLPPPDPAVDFSHAIMLPLMKRTLRDLNEHRENLVSLGKDIGKGSAAYVKTLDAHVSTLEKGRQLTWSEYYSLAKGLGKQDKCEPLGAALTTMVRSVIRCPELRRDIETRIRTLFRAARRALYSYRKFKDDRGLLDFTDLESLALRLLDTPAIQDRLAGETQLLVVDEFQDTSPIQLALFLKLARLADQVILVGDPKQAIYGFRGADPALMEAVIKATGIPRPGDILDRSYRSRPPLVRFAGELFAQALAGTMPRERVLLNPNRKDRPDTPAVFRWLCADPDGRDSVETRTMALAGGIQKLLGAQQRMQIEDPQSGELRPVRGGDIAILCKTNKECEIAAAELKILGIETARSQPGLTQTPEGHLILAALRRHTNGRDVLSALDIALLCSPNPDPAALIDARLQYLATHDREHEWLADHEVVREVDALCSVHPLLSPRTAVDRVVQLLDLRRSVAGWGRAEARRANIERFRSLAREYEERALRVGAGATMTAFLAWLDTLNEEGEDQQGAGHGPDAVQILTYHAAKGLEWPVVVLHSLHKYATVQAFGIRVLQSDEFVLEDPLAGRSIRYWPWPFGKKKNIEGLNEALADVYTVADAQAVSEDLRLLYVGITRGRDCVIAATSARGSSWWDIPFHQGGTPNLATSPGAHVWENGETRVPYVVEEVLPGLPRAAEVRSTHYVVAARTPAVHKPRFIQPSGLEKTNGTATAATPIRYGTRLVIHGQPDMETVGHALHAFLAADLQRKLTDERRAQLLSNHLRAWGIPDALEGPATLEQSRAFQEWVNTQSPEALHAERPLYRQLENGQVIRGAADLLFSCDNGWVLVDHKTFPGRSERVEEKVLSFAPQLEAYSAAIFAATGTPVCALWVHFFVLGVVVRVEIR